MEPSVTQPMVNVLETHVDSALTVPVKIPEGGGKSSMGLGKGTGWMTRAVHSKIAATVVAELQLSQTQKRPA